MKEVSAVLYSNTATASKLRTLSKSGSIFQKIEFKTLKYNNQGINPIHEVCSKRNYQESLLDGLNIFYNPTAEIPLDPRIFRNTDIIKNYYDISSGEMRIEAKHGGLIQRSCIVTNLK
jgi:hypothetical protein